MTFTRFAPLLFPLALLLAGPGCGEESVPVDRDQDASPSVPDGSVAPRDAGFSPEDGRAPTPDAARPDASASRGSLEILTGNTATGFVDGRGTEARFSGPSGGVVLPDRSAIVVADTFNGVLRRIDLATMDVSTIAGKVQVLSTADGVGTAARFQSPRAMAVAPDGSALYLADGPTVRKVALPSYTVTTIAGTAGQPGYTDGTGPTVRMGFLLHALEISADSKTLFVADRSNKCLRTVTLATGAVATVAGAPYTGANQHVDGSGAAARFSGIGGISRVDNTLYMADTFNHVLRAVDLTSFAVTTIAGAAGTAGLSDGAGATARFSSPQGLVAKNGALYSTSFDGVLRKITLPSFDVTTVLGDADDARPVDGAGAAARLGTAFAQPMADPSQNVLYYQDRSASSVRRIDLAALTVNTLAGSKDPEGTIDGAMSDARFVSPDGIAANADGSVVLVADAVTHTIRRVDTVGKTVSSYAGAVGIEGATDGPAKDARFLEPSALVWDTTKNRVYVADSGNHVVRAIDVATSTVSTVLGVAGSAGTADGSIADARIAGPVALALDPSAQMLYVAESATSAVVPGGRATIRALDLTARTVRTVAGGAPATPPVDGPAASASFTSLRGLAFDSVAKRLIVSEGSRAILRSVDVATGVVSLLAGKDNEKGPADGAFGVARFSSPAGLSFAAGDNALFVADSGSHTIRRLDFGSKIVSTWLGNPSVNGGIAPGTVLPFERSSLYFPSAPTVAGPNLLVASEHAIYLARPTDAIRQ